MMLNKLRLILSGTLRRQLIWGVVGVHALIMSLFVWDLTIRQQEMLQDQQASLATGLARSIATSTALSVVSRDLAGLQEVVEAQQRLADLSYAMILNPQGQILAHTDRQLLGKYVLDLPVQPALQVLRYSPTQVDVVNPVMVAGRHVGWIRVGFGKSDIHVQLERIVRDGVLYALAAIVIGGMLASLMAARLTRRLDRIQTVANAVQSGQSGKRVRMEGSDEAAQLGKRFDAMLEVLSEREWEILASREKLELTQYAIDHIQEGVFWIDKEGVLVNVNEYACTSLGYTCDELVGMHIGEIDPEFDSARWKQSFARKKTESHHVMETRHRCKNGSIFPVEIFSSYVSYGDREYTFTIIRDITRRKQEEAALLKSYREIEDLYHNAPCGYHSLDKAGVILKINDTELSWLGYTREEIVGRKRFVDLLTPSSIEIFRRSYPAFMLRGWVNDLEFELVRKDGTVMPVMLSATAIRDDAGNYLKSRSTIFDITERKRAEQALLDEQERTLHLLDRLPAGVVVHAPDGSIRYINSAAQAFFRMSGAAIGGRKVPDFSMRFLHEDGSAMHISELPEQKVLADGQALKNYLVGVVMSGPEETKWALVNAFPDFHSSGAINQVVVSFVDITDRILADVQLRNARIELEHILNVNPAVTYQVKLADNSNVFRSRAIVDMLGYEVGDWQTPGFWVAHIHPEDREAALLAQDTLLEKGTLQHEYRFRHRDGRWVWIFDRVNLVRDQNGKPEELVGSWLDITPRKQAEFALENLNRFYSLLTHVNEAIVRATNQSQLFEDICRIAVEDGRFVMAWVGMMDNDLHEINPVSHWGHESGYLEYLREVGILSYNGPTAQTLQTGVYRLSQDIAGDAAMNPWRQEALKRGYRSSAAFPLYLGGKVAGAINLYAADAHYFDEEIIRLLDDLARDISFALGALDQQDRRASAETQLQQLNRELEQRVADRTRELENTNKELESFSYSVSHDLRAPLRSIDGFSHLLLNKYGEHLDATGKDYLLRVRRASQHMGQLIDDLLQLSRVTRGALKREHIDLGKIAEQVADGLQRTNSERQVRFILQQNLGIFADAGLMRIVMENLLGNAYKYTGKKPVAEIEFGLRETNGESVFFVRDNGDGFNMEYAHKLFGAFQRLHGASEFEGTGIGLATVQRIIHRHHGNVWAEAKEGGGATFYFTTPQRKREN